MSTLLCEYGCIKTRLDESGKAIKALYDELDGFYEAENGMLAAEGKVRSDIQKEREKAQDRFHHEYAKCTNSPCRNKWNDWIRQEEEKFNKRVKDSVARERAASAAYEKKREDARTRHLKAAGTVGADLVKCVAKCCGKPAGPMPRVPVLGAPVERFPETVFMFDAPEGAEKFYRKWITRESIEKVGSLQEILEKVAKRTRGPRRIHIVAKGTGKHITLPLLRNVPNGNLNPDLLKAFLDGDFALMHFVLLTRPTEKSKYEQIRTRLKLHETVAYERIDEKLGLFPAKDLVKGLAIGVAVGGKLNPAAPYIRKACRTMVEAGLAEATEKEHPWLLELKEAIERQLTTGMLDIDIQPTDQKLVEAATSAVKEKQIRKTLEKVRKLMKHSCIDIRGCQGGWDPGHPEFLLLRLSDLFGVERAHITAPDVRQKYVSSASITVGAIRCEDRNQRPTAENVLVRKDLEYWAKMLSLDTYARQPSFLRFTQTWSGLYPMSDIEKLEHYLAWIRVLPVLEDLEDPLRDKWRIVLSYWVDCPAKDTMLAKRIWARSMWADPPEARVNNFVDGWNEDKEDSVPMFTCLLVDKRGVCPADREFANHIKTADD